MTNNRRSLECNSTNMFNIYTHGQTSWDTFAFLGRFPIDTGPTPLLTPQTMLGVCIQNFFPSFNFVLGTGRENWKKISKKMHLFVREPKNDRNI